MRLPSSSLIDAKRRLQELEEEIVSGKVVEKTLIAIFEDHEKEIRIFKIGNQSATRILQGRVQLSVPRKVNKK